VECPFDAGWCRIVVPTSSEETGVRLNAQFDVFAELGLYKELAVPVIQNLAPTKGVLDDLPKNRTE